MTDARLLASRYQTAHNEMRNVDGLQPQEALDELLKYLFFKERDEEACEPVEFFEGFASEATIAQADTQIRERFARYVRSSVVSPPRWREDGFLLSPCALTKLHSIFAGLRLTSTGLDLRSSALRVFLSGPLRKGLGIFLTPEEVVREIVAALEPQASDRILDPACGSGTFLMDAAQFISKVDDAQGKFFGVDKNPRMLQLAEFNCGHLNNIDFYRASADSLLPFGSAGHPDWFREGAFDLILTNPPFGVSVNGQSYSFNEFVTCTDLRKGSVKKQGSEIMFLERAMQLLRPGGRLGIVLPRSVITNQRISDARAQLGKYGCVLGMITLPPETFAATGTQTTTVVLIAEKFGPQLEQTSSIRPILARIENVGFDLTGRVRPGSQLPGLGETLATAIRTQTSQGLAQALEPVCARDSFGLLERMLGEGRAIGNSSGRTLRDLISLATTGATPPRAAYADEGLFLVKVGNLSGSGVNWVARDRNFVREANAGRYLKSGKLLMQGDILLTSSAHSSKYIGKKMDIITRIPSEVGGQASFVGEVMLLRPAKEIDPYLLLAYLRSQSVVQAMQDRVRGQTAHLHPNDVLDLPVDDGLLNAETLKRVANLIRRETELNDELNELAFSQLSLREELGEEAAFFELAAE